MVGVGIDVISISRIQASLDRHGERFVARVFTPEERTYCAARARPAEHFAARFAAKEATLKALGAPEGLSWHEMAVKNGAGGAPELQLTGAALAAAQRLGASDFKLSLSHSENTAVSIVVLQR